VSEFFAKLGKPSREIYGTRTVSENCRQTPIFKNIPGKKMMPLHTRQEEDQKQRS
jgi:hypothetical protein